MSAGRRPTPAATHALRGNPGKRPLREEATIQGEFNLTPPLFLTGDALTLWNELAPVLKESRVLTLADRTSFITLCEAWAMWRLLRERLEVCGPLCAGKTEGVVSVSPLVDAVRRAHSAYTKMAVEFGLTPTSRAKVSVAPLPKAPSKFDRIKQAPRAPDPVETGPLDAFDGTFGVDHDIH